MRKSILGRARSVAYWELDRLSGGHARRTYRELGDLESYGYGSRAVEMRRSSALGAILRHAIDTVPYYARASSLELSSFPIVDKNLIRENEASFLSQTSTGRLTVRSTSGSTGTPFRVYQDEVKRRRVAGEVIFFSERAGYSFGENLVFLRVLNDQTQKSRFSQWIQNESLLDVGRLDDPSIEALLKAIAQSSRHGSMILSYASTLDAFRDYFDRNGPSMAKGCSVLGVVSASEVLFNETRAAISDAFGCNCYSRYSNQENGILAQEQDLPGVFHVNSVNYAVEVLDEDSESVLPFGATGRIVVTDLYNRAMPLIRYDTGDLGSLDLVNDGNGVERLTITSLSGRRVDSITDGQGNRVSPHSVTNAMWEFSGVRQFQLIQEKDGYCLVLSADQDEDRDLLILRKFAEVLRSRSIVIERVDDIPILASGKRQYIVNRSGK